MLFNDDLFRILASGDLAMVSMMNNIASTHPPVPGLLQDDSNVPYCNANNLPDDCDKDIENGNPVCYCPHLIQLDIGEVYELLLLDDECEKSCQFISFAVF